MIDRWEELDWENINPYDYRYYHAIEEAMRERYVGADFFGVAKGRPILSYWFSIFFSGLERLNHAWNELERGGVYTDGFEFDSKILPFPYHPISDDVTKLDYISGGSYSRAIGFLKEAKRILQSLRYIEFRNAQLQANRPILNGKKAGGNNYVDGTSDDGDTRQSVFSASTEKVGQNIVSNPIVSTASFESLSSARHDNIIGHEILYAGRDDYLDLKINRASYGAWISRNTNAKVWIYLENLPNDTFQAPWKSGGENLPLDSYYYHPDIPPYNVVSVGGVDKKLIEISVDSVYNEPTTLFTLGAGNMPDAKEVPHPNPVSSGAIYYRDFRGRYVANFTLARMMIDTNSDDRFKYKAL